MSDTDARAAAREEAAEVARRVLAELVPHLAEAIERSTDKAMRQALGDPETWAKAVTAMKAQAQTHAGGWLFGGISSLLSKAAWVFVIGMGVYLLGGWSALVSVIKAVFGHHEP